MCLAALSPLAAMAGGSKGGLAMLSPALAIGSSLFGKKRPALDRNQILYPNDQNHRFGAGYNPATGTNS